MVALLALLGGILSPALVAVGVVAVASRARWWWTLAFALMAVGVLALPWRLHESGISVTYAGPARGLLLWVTNVVAFVVLPGLIGTIRRTTRQARIQRLGFEARQRELAADQAVAEERTRIAQEMHDVLGHKLSLITLQAGALQVNADRGPEVIEEQAELIRATSRQALDELRAIVGVLNKDNDPTFRPQPGLAEVLELVAHNQASGARIELDNRLGDAEAVPMATQTAVHRVVTEGLTNAHKHAPGAAVRLTLALEGEELQVALVNRPSSAAPPQDGIGRGLPGLRERVRARGGRLESGPTAEGGYRLAAWLPWPAATEGEADG